MAAKLKLTVDGISGDYTIITDLSLVELEAQVHKAMNESQILSFKVSRSYQNHSGVILVDFSKARSAAIISEG